jgi:hypothetical protein
MKKIYYLIAVAIISATFLSSCKKDDHGSDDSSSSSNTSTLTTVMTSGSWKVSYYHHGSDDNSHNFDGYTFTFQSNGTMTAVNSSGTVNGTWSRDDSHNEIHFSIGSSSPLSDISSGWIVSSFTGTSLKFRDDSSSDEELYFSRP